MGADYKYLINDYIDLRELHNENYTTAVHNHDFISMMTSYVYINYENNSRQNLKLDDIHKYLSTYTDLDDYADKLDNELKQYNKDKMHVLNESCELINHNSSYNSDKYVGIILSMIDGKSLDMRFIDCLYDKIMKSIIELTDNATVINNADKISFILNNEWFYDKLCFASTNTSRIIIYNRQKTAVKTVMALYDERGATYCSHIIDINHNEILKMKDINIALYNANGDITKYDNIMNAFSDEMKPFTDILSEFSNERWYNVKCFEHARNILRMYNGDLTMNETLVNIIRNEISPNPEANGKIMVSDKSTRKITELWEQSVINYDEALIADISAFMIALFIKAAWFSNYSVHSCIQNDDDIINYANNYDKYTVEYADECLKLTCPLFEGIISDFETR